MNCRCEKCGSVISICDGKYVYYQDRIVFACKACSDRISDEVKVAQKICAAIDAKKARAVDILRGKEAFDSFLKKIELTMKKIPDDGNLGSDIPLLVSITINYVDGNYHKIPENTIVAIVATLLYVISPFDIIPDFIPGVGYSDDAMAVSLCMKTFHDDINKYTTWIQSHDA